MTVEQFEKVTGISVTRYVNQFKMTIRPEVLSGKETPKWDDFEALKNLLTTFKNLDQMVKGDPETANYFSAIGAELKQTLAKDPAFQKLMALHNEVKQEKKTEYEASERELKLAYQFYVRQLNRILPKEARVPLVHLAPDARMAEINKDAATYMKTVEKNFLKIFHNTGYETYKKYVETLKSNPDPLVQKAIKLIEGDQIQVVMRRPVQARFWVPKVGFQNQFVTKSSRGTLDAGFRNTAERNLYNVEEQANYSARDAEFKPKYGTLSVKPESDVVPDLKASEQYGEDIYAFKTEKIQDRLTFFPTDSLSSGYAWSGPGTLNSSFIPWKARMLMVPFMVRALEKNEFSALPPHVSSGLLRNNPITSSRYWESQILGTVRLEDVASFTFTSAKPQGEFLRELIKHNIKIYDGTVGLGPGQLKEWKPTPADLK